MSQEWALIFLIYGFVFHARGLGEGYLFTFLLCGQQILYKLIYINYSYIILSNQLSSTKISKQQFITYFVYIYTPNWQKLDNLLNFLIRIQFNQFKQTLIFTQVLILSFQQIKIIICLNKKSQHIYSPSKFTNKNSKTQKIQKLYTNSKIMIRVQSFLSKKSGMIIPQFEFHKLDKKLNSKRIQQQKKQQLDKMSLKIITKQSFPNIRLNQQCDQVMIKYKDHYNINRIFEVYQNKKRSAKSIRNSQQIKDDNTNSLLNKTKRSSSLMNLARNQFNRDLSNIMKPLKTNAYLDNKGIIKLPDIFHESKKKYAKNQQSWKNSNFEIQKDKLSDNIVSSKSLKINSNVAKIQRLRALKKKFRKSIEIIIKKMKIMKITLDQIIRYQIFSKQSYKFGSEIFHSVKEGDQTRVFRIIMENRYSLFSVDSTQKNPLIWACIRGHSKIAELLIHNGVSISQADVNGKTPLSYAIQYENSDCVKVIISNLNQIPQDLESIKMNTEIRNILRVFTNTIQFLAQLTYQKRKIYFQEQYNYLFHN